VAGRAVAAAALAAVVLLASWWLWDGGRVGADGAGEAAPAAGGAAGGATGDAAGGTEGGDESGTETGLRSIRSTPLATEPPLRRLRVRVLARYPHDTEAFTQGLLLHGGELYESTGQYGRSSLRRVEVETGRVLAERPLPAEWFGEGLARVPGEGAGGDRLIQLTWQEGVAPVWRLDGLERLGEHHYTGEGWGLCHDPTVPGGRLVMSDGSARLTFRDPETFAETGAVAVTLEGRPVGLINELECVDGRVLANVLFSDNLLEIDPATGRVTALIQAAGLLTPAEARAADVLNGIAHDPADGTLLLTGKLWPWLFRVEVM
jgi:glutaminyl-peptide cyclotransferase